MSSWEAYELRVFHTPTGLLAYLRVRFKDRPSQSFNIRERTYRELLVSIEEKLRSQGECDAKMRGL